MKSKQYNSAYVSDFKKVKYLCVKFHGELYPHEIPAFRGAVVEKVGKKEDIFHNHKGQNNYHYRYPLVQYKSLHKQPALVCLEDGAEDLYKLFQHPDWRYSVSDRQMELEVDQLDMKTYTLQVWDKRFSYNIRNWVALNQNVYHDYQKMESLQEKTALLERILTGNLLAFAKGMNWQVGKNIEVQITNWRDSRWVSLKGNKVLAFNLDFNTNIFLPDYIGLGKSPSLGFGSVKQIRNKKA